MGWKVYRQYPKISRVKRLNPNQNVASNNLKTSPVLVDEDSYDEWKSELAIWQLYTDLDKKKQGPAVYLLLSGRARECVRDLKPEEIGAEDGVKKIIDKIDTSMI